MQRLPQRRLSGIRPSWHRPGVLWLVSADLAHTHLKSGPYGYCPCAEPFDAACGRWAQGAGLEALQEARRHQGAGAMSCGFTGLVALQGGLPSSYKGEVYARAHPTYYGMRRGLKGSKGFLLRSS